MFCFLILIILLHNQIHSLKNSLEISTGVFLSFFKNKYINLGVSFTICSFFEFSLLACSLNFFFFHVSSRNFVTVLWTLFVVVAILIINFAIDYIVMHLCLGIPIFRTTIVEVASTACAPYSYERDLIYVGVCCQIGCISNSSGLHCYLFFPNIIRHREAMSFLFISSSAPIRKHVTLLPLSV